MAAREQRILVVDDEPKIREVLVAYLEREGYGVAAAASGRQALDQMAKVGPDLVVLDLMLPDMAGEDVCRAIRRDHDTPILMLTAKTAPIDRVQGLSIGADDYVTKPFDPTEVVARVRAILRRVHSETEPLMDRLSFNGGDLMVDAAHRQVLLRGEPLSLTNTEFKLLQALVRHPGRVYSRAELVEKVQGFDFEGFERTVDAHVKNLRQKLGDDPRQPAYVVTVYGVGYKFGGQPDA
ncbi:MAG: response regulator transcription factor [Symbiobacteriia bacterium]